MYYYCFSAYSARSSNIFIIIYYIIIIWNFIIIIIIICVKNVSNNNFSALFFFGDYYFAISRHSYRNTEYRIIVLCWLQEFNFIFYYIKVISKERGIERDKEKAWKFCGGYMCHVCWCSTVILSSSLCQTLLKKSYGYRRVLQILRQWTLISNIRNHQKTRFRSLTDDLCIVVKEIKILFNLV